MPLTKLEAITAYAKMVNTLDVCHLEPLLAEDFHYASQWVFEELETKDAYLEYIKKKFDAIKADSSTVFAELGRISPDEPCAVIAQGGKDELQAVVLVKIEANKIQRMDMCIVPGPHDAVRTGEYPGLQV